jgi:hypothetical protein
LRIDLGRIRLEIRNTIAPEPALDQMPKVARRPVDRF